MKNNWGNRFIYNLGLDHIGPSRWGWFVIPNFIWNSGLAQKIPKLYAFTERFRN